MSNDTGAKAARTTLAYEVVVFAEPQVNRDLTVRVNNEVRRVRVWAGHMGPVRVVSLSNSARGPYGGTITLTIEYTAHDTSIDQ